MLVATVDRDIAELDLQCVALRLRKKLEWGETRIEDALDEYRTFLQLRRDEPHEVHRPLSTDMDKAWHAHILHTKKYGLDCQSLFGEFLHHTPSATQDDCCDCACS